MSPYMRLRVWKRIRAQKGLALGRASVRIERRPYAVEIILTALGAMAIGWVIVCWILHFFY